MQTDTEFNRILNNYLSVDCVGFDFENLNVLLVEKTLTDFENDEVVFADLILTGNHVYEDETLEEATNRVLFDLTGFTDIYMGQFKTFADPLRLSKPNDQKWLLYKGRDPNKRIISVGFV